MRIGRYTIGRDSLPVDALKLEQPEFIRYIDNLIVNVWRTGDAPQQWKM